MTLALSASASAAPAGGKAKDAKPEVGTVSVDVRCQQALARIDAELKATRLRVAVHTAHFADAKALDEKVDALQIGVSVLSLPEVLSRPTDLPPKKKGRANDTELAEAVCELVTYAPDPSADERAEQRRTRQDLLQALDALPTAEQDVAIHLYGLDLEKPPLDDSLMTP